MRAGRSGSAGERVDKKRIRGNVRSSRRVQQNVPVLEVLGFRAVLQVLLEAVASVGGAYGRDWRLVNGSGVVGGLGRHDEKVWRSQFGVRKLGLVFFFDDVAGS